MECKLAVWKTGGGVFYMWQDASGENIAVLLRFPGTSYWCLRSSTRLMASSNDNLLRAGQKHTVARLRLLFLESRTHARFRSCFLDRRRHMPWRAFLFYSRSRPRVMIEYEVGGGRGGIYVTINRGGRDISQPTSNFSRINVI